MTFAFLIYISSAYASVLSEAKTAVSEIQNVYKDMEKKAKDAAKSGDKQKQQCIMAKMSYISPLVEVSKASLSTIETEAANGNNTKAGIELRKIKVAKNQVEQAESESKNCKGSTTSKSTPTSPGLKSKATTAGRFSKS